MHPLTTKEVEICRLAEVSIEDAAFLKELTNKPIELLEIPNNNDYSNRADHPVLKGIHSYSRYEDARGIVLANYDRFQDEGKILFQGDTLFLNEKEAGERGLPSETVVQATICLVSTTSDPLKVIEAFGTSWPNCRITNQTAVNQLRSWNERFGLKIYLISEDFISARLQATNIDYEALAKEIFAMCADPDNIQHSLEEETETIKSSGDITLWWD